MISFERKMELKREAKSIAAARRQAQGHRRAGQVSRSTVRVGDTDMALDNVLVGAVDEAAAGESRDSDIAFLDESDVDSFDTVIDAGDAADVDSMLDAQDSDPDLINEFEATTSADEDAHQADMTGIAAAQFAAQLDADLSAAKVELEQALADAQTALDEAGLARTDAGEAVSAAAEAVIHASQAIEDALAAQELANGAAPEWSTAAPSSGDAAGRPVGAIWYVRNGAGRVTQLWELTSLGWLQRPFDEAVVPAIAIGSGTYGTLAGSRLVAESVTAGEIAALAVTAAKIAADAVTAAKIAANAVTAEKINAGAVTTTKLDALAVTAEKLAVGAVVADKIAANAITSAKIAATAIDGMTITGSTMRTAASGQRMEFNQYGLQGYNALGAVVANIFTTQEGYLTVSGSNNTLAALSGGLSRWTYLNREFLITQSGGIRATNYKSVTDQTVVSEFQLAESSGLAAYAKGKISVSQQFGNDPSMPASQGLSVQGPKPGGIASDAREARVQFTGYDNFLFANDGGWFQTYGQLRSNGLQVFGTPGDASKKSTFYGDVDFSALPHFPNDYSQWAVSSVPGASGTFEYLKYMNKMWCRFDITYTASVASMAYADDPRVLIPSGSRPASSVPLNVLASGALQASATVNAAGEFRIRNLHSAAVSRWYGVGFWDLP